MLTTNDRAGRVVVPKALRDRFNLTGGTVLEIKAVGDGLRPQTLMVGLTTPQHERDSGRSATIPGSAGIPRMGEAGDARAPSGALPERTCTAKDRRRNRPGAQAWNPRAHGSTRATLDFGEFII